MRRALSLVVVLAALICAALTSASTASATCFSSPSSCSYPGATVSPAGFTCSSLPTWTSADLPSGDVTMSGETAAIIGNNLTINGYNVPYQLYLDGANHFTLENSCVRYDGSQETGPSGTYAVAVNGTQGDDSYLTVYNDRIIAPGCTSLGVCTSSEIDETDVSDGSSHVTINASVLAGAVENITDLGANSIIENSFVTANAIQAGGHNETYYQYAGGPVSITANTLLNPFDQSAVIYGDDTTMSGTCSNDLSVTNNFLAGGGRILTECGTGNRMTAELVGTSSLTFTGNQIARCDGGVGNSDPLGGEHCGTTNVGSNGEANGAGEDTYGYWPQGGFFGADLDTFCADPSVTWSGNYWDDGSAAFAC